MALELVHGKPGSEGFEVLDLSCSVWDKIVARAKEGGWSPSAETIENTSNFSTSFCWDKPAHIPTEETLAMGHALETAQANPALNKVTLPSNLTELAELDGLKFALRDPNYGHFNPLTDEMVRRVIQFLHKGAVTYASWD